MSKTNENFNDFLIKELNGPQQDAVNFGNGAILVVAGAGSGKTRVITARIANLILNHNVPAKSITALTFTNKAAGEMKERVGRFVGVDNELPFVGTFHSYCLLLLKTNAARLSLPQFSILDSDDQVDLLKKIVKKNSINKFATPSQLAGQISKLKNQGIIDDAVDASFIHPTLKEIYLEYEAEKANAHYLDFDDLLIQILKLLKSNNAFRANFQKSIRHLLVDEYQDTNHVQHQLLKLMGLNDQQKLGIDSLCAVGDEDQSIYSWRGATVANMLKFQQDFAPVHRIKIEQNYRSVQPILDAANNVISNNLLRNPKNLWSDKKAKNRILVANCRTGEQEAEAISTFIKGLPKNKKMSDIAILYRTHFQSRAIEEALIYNSIPYKIIGGIRFYERKEIKDLLAYMRLVVNPYDKVSLLRVINCPARGLGQKFEEQIIDEWRKNPLLDFKQLLAFICESPQIGLPDSKKIKTTEFLAIFDNFEQSDIPSYVLEQIIERTEYLAYLREEYEPREAEIKLGNVKEFLQSSINFELSFKPQQATAHHLDPFHVVANEPTLETFLQEISLMQEKLNSANSHDQVQMMTLHAAKGLEFDYIIITGVEESLLPSSKSLNTNDELEEERRLFYVGITRAKEFLLLFHASARNTFGQFSDQVPSRFLSEIPNNLTQHIDFERIYNTIQIKEIFTNWLDNKPITLTAPQPSFAQHTSYASVTNKVHTTLANTKTTVIPAKWYKNQNIKHPKFGIGIVKSVEKAGDDEYYLTIIFKTGQKKILSSFLGEQ